MRGRKPKHPKLKVLEGNRGKRKVQPAPEPGAGPPDPPEWLTEDAIAEWQRIVPLLETSGILTRVDLALLVSYCEAWSDYRECRRQLAEQGKTHIDDKGVERRSPWCILEKQAREAFLKAAEQLGCSPVSRSRLHVEAEKDPGSDLDEYARRPRVVG
jgi:P27 family predicted phage terminase small subunit